MRFRTAPLVLMFAFFCSTSEASTLEFIKIIEISGQVEIENQVNKRITKALPGRQLKKSEILRTKAGSFAELSFDANLEQAGRLSQDSEIIFLEAPNRLHLTRGVLMMMLEQEKSNKENDGVYVTTRDLVHHLAVGGATVVAGDKFSMVKVFSENADIASIETPNNFRSVHEGFKCILKKDNRHTERMSFEDYHFWQAWIKKHYLKKDEWNEKKLEKEFNL